MFAWTRYNVVVDYGAVGDGVTDDTPAFVAALRDLAKHGGGTLYVPGKRIVLHGNNGDLSSTPQVSSSSSSSSSSPFIGVYLIRPLMLTTNHLHIVLGPYTTLLGYGDVQAWPLLPPLPSYGQGRGGGWWRHASLLQGIHVHNVTIQGEEQDYHHHGGRRNHRPTSVIDGQGSFWWDRIRNGTLEYNAGHLIEFMYSSHIFLDNIRLHNSPSWNNHFYDCDHVHVRRMDIWAPESSPFTDGWDPDSCRNVLIEDSTYAAGDDCVAIKSGWDCFGVNYGKPAVNITIRNVTCHGYSAGIAIGSEMSGGIENITVQHVRFTKSNKPADIKVGKTRGGYVRNVIVSDVIVDGPIQRAIHVDMYHYNDSPNPSCPPDWKPPTLTQISNPSFVRFDGSNATYYDYKHCPNKTFHFLAYLDSHSKRVHGGRVFSHQWSCVELQRCTRRRQGSHGDPMAALPWLCGDGNNNAIRESSSPPDY